jgi:hypothetical protein
MCFGGFTQKKQRGMKHTKRQFPLSAPVLAYEPHVLAIYISKDRQKAGPIDIQSAQNLVAGSLCFVHCLLALLLFGLVLLIGIVAIACIQHVNTTNVFLC